MYIYTYIHIHIYIYTYTYIYIHTLYYILYFNIFEYTVIYLVYIQTHLLPGEYRCWHTHRLTAQVHLRATHIVDLTWWSDNDWSCKQTEEQVTDHCQLI